HVVEDLRDGDRLGDGAEVAVETFLGGLVVVGGDQQAGIGADALGQLGELDGFPGAVGPGAGDHRDAAVDLVGDAADHFDVFLHVQGGGFARGADRDDGVGAFLQVEVHQFAQAVPVQCALRIHGSDQRHHAARNHLP